MSLLLHNLPKSIIDSHILLSSLSWAPGTMLNVYFLNGGQFYLFVIVTVIYNEMQYYILLEINLVLCLLNLFKYSSAGVSFMLAASLCGSENHEVWFKGCDVEWSNANSFSFVSCCKVTYLMLLPVTLRARRPRRWNFWEKMFNLEYTGHTNTWL